MNSLREFLFLTTYVYSRLLKKLRGIALRNSKIHKTSKIESGSTVINTVFKKHSFCGYDCLFNNCEVGSFTSIAGKVIVGGSAHPVHYVSTSPVFLSHKDSVKTKFSRHDFYYIPKTTIGNDVWVGEGAYIKAGINIGHGAVIGMGSVVTKDVPAYAIVAGNPAKLVRMRFESEIVDAMLKIKWWDFSDEELARAAHHFTDPSKFIENMK